MIPVVGTSANDRVRATTYGAPLNSVTCCCCNFLPQQIH